MHATVILLFLVFKYFLLTFKPKWWPWAVNLSISYYYRVATADIILFMCVFFEVD